MATAFEAILLSTILLALAKCSVQETEPKLVFQEKHRKTHYVKMLSTLPEMMEFTLCYWLKPHEIENRQQHVFSYAGRKNPDLLLTWFKATPGQNGKTTVGVNIAGTKAEMTAMVSQIKLNTWSHICFSWSSWSLTGMIYLNGSAIMDRVIKFNQLHHATELKIKTGGVVVLGQDQDAFGGGFHKEDAFVGELQGVQLWDERFKDPYVKHIGKPDSTHTGNILAWTKSAMAIRDVYVERCNLE